MIDDSARPRKFDLTSQADCLRLIRETIGYLETCRREHHGTDWEGRVFAIEALKEFFLQLGQVSTS